MNFNYDELLKEIPVIDQEYRLGNLDDLIETIEMTEVLSRDDLRDAIIKFTPPGTIYFETLIRFLEFQMFINK